MSTRVWYHGNCWDGLVAAWVASIYLPADTIFVPVLHGVVPPAHEFYDTIYILDFSYSRKLMLAMSRFVTLTVLDHHKSAYEACEGLPFAHFDMDKSGAAMAWDYFTKDREPANGGDLVNYVQDRDLWKFELPHSEDINAYIQSYQMTFDSCEKLAYFLDRSITDCAGFGKSIRRYQETIVERMCAEVQFQVLAGYIVPVVNATILFSEVGHRLCEIHKDYPFSASYFDRKDRVTQWSLRSIGEFDVSLVAKHYNGGGHKNAAGFQIPIIQGEDIHGIGASERANRSREAGPGPEGNSEGS